MNSIDHIGFIVSNVTAAMFGRITTPDPSRPPARMAFSKALYFVGITKRNITLPQVLWPVL